MSDEPMLDDLAELEALAAKCEQETQVFLGSRNLERAESIRRVLAALRASRQAVEALRGEREEIRKACDAGLRLELPAREIVSRIRAALSRPEEGP